MHDLECTKQWSRKNHLLCAFPFIQLLRNVTSSDCCCCLIFIHVLTTVRLSLHKSSSPTFHVSTDWYATCPRPDQSTDNALLCCLVTDVTHVVHFTVTDHHNSFFARGNIITGFVFVPVSWLVPDLLTEETEHYSEIFQEPNCCLFQIHILNTDEIPVRQFFKIRLQFFL